MNLQLIGVNHRTAPVEVRERFAVSEKKLPEALQSLVNHPGISEGLIISTCNRVEILAGSKNGECDIRPFLCKYFEIDPADFDKYTYEFREKDAIKHLFPRDLEPGFDGRRRAANPRTSEGSLRRRARDRRRPFANGRPAYALVRRRQESP